MSEQINNGIELTIPSPGETNWATLMRTCFQTLSGHGHTGDGDGAQITANAIASDALTDAKIRLRNNQWLRARNAADSADVNILRVNSSNNLELNLTIDGASLSDDSITDAKVRLRNNQYLRARNAAGSADVNIVKINASNALEFALGIDGASLTAGSVATSKIANISTDVLLGRDTAGSGAIQEITMGTGLEFSGASAIRISDSGVSTAKIANNAVDDTKIRLRNANYLVARNAAGAADVNILRINSSDELEIVYTGALKLGTGGSSTANIDIGTSSDISCNIPTGEQFKITEAGTTKVRYQSSVWMAPSGQTIALGNAANPWTNISQAGYHEMADTTAPSNPAAGATRLYFESGTLKSKDSSGTVRTYSYT